MARMHSTPQRPFPFSHPVSSSPLSPTSLPFGPASITHKSVCRTRYTDLLGATRAGHAEGAVLRDPGQVCKTIRDARVGWLECTAPAEALPPPIQRSEIYFRQEG
eukprot:1184417-Prorocentrum_minimum.AAC.4